MNWSLIQRLRNITIKDSQKKCNQLKPEFKGIRKSKKVEYIVYMHILCTCTYCVNLCIYTIF